MITRFMGENFFLAAVKSRENEENEKSRFPCECRAWMRGYFSYWQGKWKLLHVFFVVKGKSLKIYDISIFVDRKLVFLKVQQLLNTSNFL